MPRLLILCLTLAHLWIATPVDAAEPSLSWKAAAGSVVITPDRPLWMAGYASRNKPSEGTAQDLFAKVLVLEDNSQSRLAIVTLDLIGVPKEFREDIVAECRERFQLSPDSILLNASHTHCGPELRVFKIRHYGGDAAREAMAIEYTRGLVEKIVKLIGQTLDRLEPAQLEVTHGRAGFAMNRRLPTANGVINSPYPDGPVDHEVPVLKVLGKDDKLRAVLFGYACHNTTLSFYQFCGDYAGYAQEYLEAAHPGVTCLFMMGCGGDQNPYPRRTLDLAQQHGRALANAVETALEARQPRQVDGPLRVALGDVILDFQKPSQEDIESEAQSSNKYQRRHGERLLAELKENGRIQTEYAFPVQAVQLGDDITLVALPGEAVVDYSLLFKSELKDDSTNGPKIWVAGYSNHVFGYLPSRRVLEEGGYEGRRAMIYSAYPGPFAASVEDRVTAKVKELVRQVRSAPKKTQPQE
ncbi:neutral/alkaline non-lysosomal ceramidase N-terminal domain-containing protein [Thalassoroseus pseudoceratinae]|uniref:neutral/alkaline non-lysosomal ceramidase N-terminal domain-containing protein n=1 Tax=Thalassoroseus pseudoceratinae TaxID=2713176 RepID=UPI0014203F46|nr:neutral/alkaline non-lysosomal ceramidase N-terminal domain-containing protein [Thalassoroseus pseudoceratinae]